ncbi:hypothetical protein ACQJBY_014944 [Aegilops geniculata]
MYFRCIQVQVVNLNSPSRRAPSYSNLPQPPPPLSTGAEQVCAAANSSLAKGNDYHSKVSGLGACEEEQLLLDQAVWQQQRQGPVSQGPNNLYNVRYHKFSGLANSKTVAVQPIAGEEKAVVLSTRPRSRTPMPSCCTRL